MHLGLIEGFYGPIWSRAEREALASHLTAHGYRFWHYAPKADPAVRTAWRRPWPDEQARGLAAFARHCRHLGLRFGIGLSPVGLAAEGPRTDWDALAARITQLDAIGIDDLVIGFDDMRDDAPDLAARQARIAEWMAARTGAAQIIVCPTYYSDDPLLDRLFGDRPNGYLEALGHALDPAIGVYWAGGEMIPREIAPGHMDAVAERLGRRPWLWDNYPVNDGPSACDHLHLRAFTGRPAELAGRITGHAINPALQPTLSAIPALTLPSRYRQGHDFVYTDAFQAAAREVLGGALAECVVEDLPLLEDAGRERLGSQAESLRARYAEFDHPGAREILRWLDGDYRPAEAAPAAQ